VVPGFHPIELVFVVLLALLIFGPKRLPEMGSAVGKTIKEFQKSMREVTQPSADANSAPLPSASVRPAEPEQIAAPGTQAPAAGTATEPAKQQDTVAG
jgi:sec-independent protein translocase protein TatA